MLRNIIIIALIIFAFLIFGLKLFNIFLGNSYQITGNGMSPILRDEEYVVADIFTYKNSEPKRGDIIIIKDPQSTKNNLAKRIVGLPGETISFLSGEVLINDQPINEPYLNKDLITGPGGHLREGEHLLVPLGSYYCLGDDRTHDGNDSRAFGFVKREDILGKFWFRYF